MHAVALEQICRAQALPDNPTREKIFSPDFPAPDEGDGFAVKPDTWR